MVEKAFAETKWSAMRVKSDLMAQEDTIANKLDERRLSRNSKISRRSISFSEEQLNSIFGETEESDCAAGRKASMEVESDHKRTKSVNFLDDFEKIIVDHMNKMYQITLNIKN